MGSIAETPCARGSISAYNQSAECDACLPGTYQDETGRTQCKECTPGHVCTSGSMAPQPLPTGLVWSQQYGLQKTSQADECPLGFCCAGSISPQPLSQGYSRSADEAWLGRLLHKVPGSNGILKV
eukprot:1123065-Prymnesium_polylepis.1